MIPNGESINIADTYGIVNDAGNTLACETLRLPFEVAAHFRRDIDALFGRAGTRGLARLAGLSRARCSGIAARGQQAPPVHLFQPAISSPPGKNARSRTSKCTLAALT